MIICPCSEYQHFRRHLVYNDFEIVDFHIFILSQRIESNPELWQVNFNEQVGYAAYHMPIRVTLLPAINWNNYEQRI